MNLNYYNIKQNSYKYSSLMYLLKTPDGYFSLHHNFCRSPKQLD